MLKSAQLPEGPLSEVVLGSRSCPTQGGLLKAGGIILASRTILGRQPGWARMGARAGHAMVLVPRYPALSPH